MLAPDLARVDELAVHQPVPALGLGPVAAGGWYPAVKHAAERLAALLLLVLTLPLTLVGMALVKLTSRGPALYKQARVGPGGRPFTLYKIRSMVYQCEDLTGATWCRPGDSRITRVGRWLRRTHIDELPQLWNVLKGDMSLIGPRPERPEFVPQLEKAIPLYRRRLLVRPGLTGLAQVQLPPDTDLASVRRKLAYDLYYLQHIACWLDFRIALATVLHMLGCPFRWIRALFAFPRQPTIEALYDAWLAEPAAAKTPSVSDDTGDALPANALDANTLSAIAAAAGPGAVAPELPQVT